MDKTERKYIEKPSYNDEISSEQLYNDKFDNEIKIHYAPHTNFTSDLMYLVQLKFSLNSESIKGFENETELLTNIEYANDAVMCVIFKNTTAHEIPKKLDYTIRAYAEHVDWETELLYKTSYSYIPDLGSSTYLYRGVLALQMALETSYIDLSVPDQKNSFTILMQEFPYPPYVDISGTADMLDYVPLVTVLSFLFICGNLLSSITESKVSGMKEFLKLNGMNSATIWAAHLIDELCVNLIPLILITLFLKLPLFNSTTALIHHCDGFLLFTFLTFYCVSVIIFCFAFGSIFNKVSYAFTVTLIVWIATYIISKFLINQNMTLSKMVWLGLFPNGALLFGFKIISVFENREIGASWNNFLEAPSGGSEELTMAYVFFVSLLVQFLIKVNTPTLQNFVLFTIFQCPTHLLASKGNNCSYHQLHNNDYIEKAELPVNIKIRNLKKSYGNKDVVNNVSVDIYKGEITVLLGKNGAGKTTMLSMITDNEEKQINNPYEEKIQIWGEEVDVNPKGRVNSLSIRISFCPQHNLQFNELTVQEHLIFFGMLKGLSKKDAISQSDELIGVMNLNAKKNSLVSTLSGGMKRKLSLAIAVIGNSEILILDEPSSGLDPKVRRDIWDFIGSLRLFRTVILTTHLMEEAEALSDRIAIIECGELVAYGTPMYLRKVYCIGLHLEVLADKMSQDKFKFTTKIENVSTTVTELSTKLNYNFTFPETHKDHFISCIKELENEKGIIYIQVSETKLEDVFLKANVTSAKGFQSKENSSFSKDNISNTFQAETNIQVTMFKQFWILFKKWMEFTKWKLHIVQGLALLGILLLILYFGELEPKQIFSGSKFDVKLQQYGTTNVFYSSQNSDTLLKGISQHYNNIVKDQQSNAIDVANVTEAIINEGVRNIEFYKQHLVIAAEFFQLGEERFAKAMYSNNAIHGSLISLNLLTNAILKGLTSDQYSVTVQINPLPGPKVHASGKIYLMQVLTLWYCLLPLGMVLLTALFIFVPQTERITYIKQLQIMCGISRVLYWLTCYLWHLVLYTLSIGLVLIILYTLNEFLSISHIFRGEAIAALFVIMLVYGFASIPYAYLFTYRSSTAASFRLFVVLNLFIGNLMALLIAYHDLSDNCHLEEIAVILKKIFFLFPILGLKFGTVELVKKAVWNRNWGIISPEHRQTLCATNHNPCCDSTLSQCARYQSYFNFEEISIMSICTEVLASTLLYLLILFLVELNLFKLFKMYRIRKQAEQPTKEAEESIKLNGALLQVKDVSKKKGKQEVVKEITFETNSNGCFGLLGSNGAGKTTTLRILSGEELPDKGNIQLNLNDEKVISIFDDEVEFLRNVGYCPQTDSDIDLTNGRSLLELFGNLRGVLNIDKEVTKLITALDLTDCANNLCSTYSGGNKRKLSTAIALVGFPRLIILDEPTAGIDPISRRLLWDTLLLYQKKDRSSMVISTHMLEECEILCEKVAVLDSGKIVMQESLSDLKAKFKGYFTTKFKLKIQSGNNLAKDMESFKQDFETIFTECTLKKQRAGLLQYNIKCDRKRLSDLFEIMENLQKKHSIIEDYELTRISLEEMLNNNSNNICRHNSTFKAETFE
ncbi:hypothetical protein FQA39_LY04668 [Lamprigera yunnana]|nr:hypothetical protein FQA39_LY04668 [Lamprigera yunnana]